MTNIDYGNKNSFQKLVDKIKSKLASVALSGKYSDLTGKPTSMKNPSALTFTGGVTGSYDGSASKTVNIPTTLPASNTTSDYSATGTAPVNGTAVNKALQTLDYVKTIGDIMTGGLTIKKNGSGFYVLAEDSSQGVELAISADKVTRGLWDKALSAFFAYLDSSNYFHIRPRFIADNVSLFKRSTGQGWYYGNNGTGGWVVVAQIKVLKEWANYTLEFKIGGRGRALLTTLAIMFNAQESVDPTLLGFYCYGSDYSGSVYRLKKTATSTWQLAAAKNEIYGSIYIASVQTEGEATGLFGITYPNTHLSTAPDSTWIAPTYAGVINRALKADVLSTARNINGISFNGNNNIVFFGDCATAGATAAKVATCPGYVLTERSFLLIRFQYANTAANPTLNVNGTGAKSILYPADYGVVGAFLAASFMFWYNGTGWVVMDYGKTLMEKGGTIKNTLVLSKTTDVSGTADNSPALIIGTRTGAHLEFDGNEIMAKSNATTPSVLNLNIDGGIVVVGPDGILNTGTYNIKRGSKTYKIIDAFDDGASTNNGLEGVIQFGGNLFIGSGESPTNLRNQLAAGNGGEVTYLKTGEALYISSDTFISFLAKCNTIDNKYGFYLSRASDGTKNLTPYTNGDIDLGQAGSRWRIGYIRKINSDHETVSYLKGNQNGAIINSMAPAGAYVILAKMNATSGKMTLGTYQNKFLLQYTDQATIDAGTNAVTKSATLLDAVGNTSFPGTVTAPQFNGLATKASRIQEYLVGISGTLQANHWYKAADLNIAAARSYVDSYVVFLITLPCYGYDFYALAYAYVRKGSASNANPDAVKVGWLFKSANLPANALALKRLDSNTAAFHYGLYLNVNENYRTFSITVLSMTNRTEPGYDDWTFANNVKANGDIASLTASGKNVVISDLDYSLETNIFSSVKYSTPTSNATGDNSCAFGYKTVASGNYSYAEGVETKANGINSHAEGRFTTTNASYSHAEGYGSVADGVYSHSGGSYTISSNGSSMATGHYNAGMVTGGTVANTTGTAFVVGCGTSDTARANALSVQFSGVVKAKSTITASTAADYAEYFEWEDGNGSFEDRVGLFVTIEGEKIRIANETDEYILGIVSGEPFVLGNGDCDAWSGMYLRDDFGRILYEQAPYVKLNEETGEFEQQYDEDGNMLYYGTRPVLNPDYNPDEPYVSRADRPEWAAIGMLGVLSVKQDGSILTPNVYCTVGENGMATFSLSGGLNCYRVIKVISPEIVKVIFR